MGLVSNVLIQICQHKIYICHTDDALSKRIEVISIKGNEIKI